MRRAFLTRYELMEGGDLFNRIHSKKHSFHWRERVCVAYDAACGLSHLHHQTPKERSVEGLDL